MSKAYFNDRGAAERAVLYGRTHKDQKPSNDSQIVKLLAQVRDRLADIERERGELVETIQDQDKKLSEIEDRSTCTEKTFISLENRLSRSEMKEAPIIERLDNVERTQKEGGDENTADLRSEIISRIEESDMKTSQMIERIDESMAMQSRMTRRIDKIVQDKQRLNRKLSRLEESMEATRNALASKALLLLSDKDVIAARSDIPNIPSFPKIESDDEFLQHREDAQEEKIVLKNRVDDFDARAHEAPAAAGNGFFKQAAVTTGFVVVAAIGGWFLSQNINTPTNNYTNAYTPANSQQAVVVPKFTLPPSDPADTPSLANNATTLDYLKNDFSAQAEETVAKTLNDIEPSISPAAGIVDITETKLSDLKDDTTVIKNAPQEEKTLQIFAADEKLPKAFKQLEMDAFKGNAEAQHDLAAMYTAGHGGVVQDFERAAYWFTKASNQGVSNASYNLGVLYHQGMGVEQDLGKALEWYTKAAELGHPEAQYNLGIAYVEGIGVDYNPQKAAEYFEAAASSGIPESAFNLGLIYENGLLGTAKPNEALLWYKTAADLGNEDAKNAMNQLAKTLKLNASDLDGLVNQFPDPLQKLGQQGNVSTLITQIQEQLSGFGLYPGTADGFKGPLTADAIRLYQARNDIPVNGEPSEELLVHMLTKNLKNSSYPELGSAEQP